MILCLNCNYETSNPKFCTKSCAATYNNKLRKPKNQTYSKVSWCVDCLSIIPYRILKRCSDCSTLFKSKTAKLLHKTSKTFGKNGSLGGRNSSTIVCKRSKHEINLYEYCVNYFNKVEHNIPIFNGWDADIIIHDIKTAILWNGPWHYKDMKLNNHSLIQVQTRDKIKISEIEKLGWKVLVFEDRYFTPTTAFEFIKTN